MDSLGEMLRREREARGVSLEEISEQTKIGVRLLRAIENQQFDRLPGGVFNRSFVRQYARYLGVDEEKAVRDYLRLIGASRQEPTVEHAAPPKPRASAAVSAYLPIILTAVGLGALIGGGLYAIYHFRELLYPSNPPAAVVAPPPQQTMPGSSDTGSTSKESSRPEASGGETSEMPGSAPSRSSSLSSQPSLPAETSSGLPAGDEAEARAVPAAADAVMVEIAARGTVWVSITADGEKQWQGTLRPNQTRQVQASGSVRLTVGDAGAVALLLNGKPLPPL